MAWSCFFSDMYRMFGDCSGQGEPVRLFQQGAEHVEQVPLHFDVSPHVGLPQSQFRGLQQGLLGNVFVDDQGEFRLPLTNGILLPMNLDIETVLVKMPQIIKENDPSFYEMT